MHAVTDDRGRLESLSSFPSPPEDGAEARARQTALGRPVAGPQGTPDRPGPWRASPPLSGATCTRVHHPAPLRYFYEASVEWAPAVRRTP